MNPPFSHATPWARKFIDNNNGVALLPVSRSHWFNEMWNVADAIASTPPVFKFEYKGGGQKTISFQTFLFALGEPSKTALHNMNIGRVR